MENNKNINTHQIAEFLNENRTIQVEYNQGRPHVPYKIHTMAQSINYICGGGLLGEGAGGKVYYANFGNNNPLKNLTLLDGQGFAMKMVVYEEQEYDHEAIKKEIEMIQSVHNECIISLYDWGYTKTHYYLFTECLWKGTLKDYASKFVNNIIPELEIRIFAIQIAEGLSALHAKGIIHRDIKPGNVFTDFKGHTIFGLLARLGDLGSAIHFAENEFRSSRKSVQEPEEEDPTKSAKYRAFAGTKAYMAPEVENGDRYGRMADIWSFGAVIYQMHFGKCPVKKDFVRPISTDSTLMLENSTSSLYDLMEQMLRINPQNRSTISKLLATPFLQPGYRQLRLWRIELRYAISFGTLIKQLLLNRQKLGDDQQQNAGNIPTQQLPLLMAPFVQTMSTWAMAFYAKNKTEIKRIVDALVTDQNNTATKMFEGKLGIFEEQCQINTVLETIVGWIYTHNEGKALFHYKGMSKMQEKLYGMLFSAAERVSQMRKNTFEGIKSPKFLHSILFGRVMDLCYCEECFEFLLGDQMPANNKNNVGENIVAMECANNELVSEFELETRRQEFLEKYLQKMLANSANSPAAADLLIFFQSQSFIPILLLKQKFEIIKSVIFGHEARGTMIRMVMGKEAREEEEEGENNDGEEEEEGENNDGEEEEEGENNDGEEEEEGENNDGEEKKKKKNVKVDDHKFEVTMLVMEAIPGMREEHLARYLNTMKIGCLRIRNLI